MVNGSNLMIFSRILKMQMRHGYMPIFIVRKVIQETRTTGTGELVKKDLPFHWRTSGRP